jgi:hypothetical protein
MVNRSPWPAVELTEAQSSGRSESRRLAVRVATRRGRGGATGGPLTRAWMAVRRRRDGGGISAWNGDDMGVVESRRGQPMVWECSVGAGVLL